MNAHGPEQQGATSLPGEWRNRQETAFAEPGAGRGLQAETCRSEVGAEPCWLLQGVSEPRQGLQTFQGPQAGHWQPLGQLVVQLAARRQEALRLELLTLPFSSCGIQPIPNLCHFVF